MRLGVIDVGSNTVHLLVVDAHPGASPVPYHSERTTLRLMRYLDEDERITEEGQLALISAIRNAVGIVASIIGNPEVVILDEPFAAVDRHTTEDLMALLRQWHAEGRTVIVVLHDLELVRSLFPKALLLAGQVVAWGDTEQVLTPENLHLARHLCAGDYL